MKIKKKVNCPFFQKILDGDKNFELRLADWQCQIGDILVLKEYDAIKKKYTGRELEKEITYLLKTKDLKFWTEAEIKKYGYQIIGFKNE